MPRQEPTRDEHDEQQQDEAERLGLQRKHAPKSAPAKAYARADSRVSADQPATTAQVKRNV